MHYFHIILSGGLSDAYLQDSLRQTSLMSEASPVFAVRVVLLGKV